MTGNIRWQRLDAVLPNERFNMQVRKKAVLRHGWSLCENPSRPR
jgi:hypothetical protein